MATKRHQGRWFMEQARKASPLRLCEGCGLFLDAAGKPLTPQPQALGVPEMVSQCAACQERIERGRNCLPKDD